MKRVLDIVLGSLALIITAPIMIGTAVVVWAAMGRPVLFTQRRVGWRERIFTVYKFRTMRGESVPGREALDDEERVTRVGALLRRLSIDELPQLWNVLRGDMSLVGPRPLLVEYLRVYSPAQRRRHDVRPGMTGLAQVSGRNATTWDDRLALDTWYADHHTLGLDLRIMGRTILHIVRVGRQAADGHRPMPRFDHQVGDADRPV
ncbi:MAG TPA: sugar transferase [Gemmatimonadaceae bacterium]|nr:sugar transferase [Gemmatimonadaceae bacterium]